MHPETYALLARERISGFLAEADARRRARALSGFGMPRWFRHMAPRVPFGPGMGRTRGRFAWSARSDEALAGANPVPRSG